MDTEQTPVRIGKTSEPEHWLTSLPPDFKNPLRERRKALIFGLDSADSEEMELLMEELRLLLANLDVEVVANMLQKRAQPDPAFLIGSGKANHMAVLAKASGADLVVCNDMLSPIQLSNLRKTADCEVWDRALVIMKIFERRASTAEAKLQVDLARFRYEMPHLKGLGRQMSNAGAGIGTRGPGETEFERHRRKLGRRIAEISRKLEEMERRRQGQRKQRRRIGLPTAALVGYTNSGKTTLLRRLSGDHKLYAADQLFATLDTAVRTIHLPGGKRFLMADTVGFIRRLPPQLTAAFRTTLEEICHADIIFVVLDVNDPQVLDTYDVIQRTLMDIGAAALPRTILLNKIDRAGPLRTKRVMEQFKDREGAPVYGVSALTGQGLEDLWEVLSWVTPQPLREERANASQHDRF